jgi:hypothetical protein
MLKAVLKEVKKKESKKTLRIVANTGVSFKLA